MQDQILLNDGKIGWRKTLGITDNNILFLKNNKVERYIPLKSIVEAYPKTCLFTNVTQLCLKLTDNTIETITFKTGDLGLLLGGMDYAESNATNITNRYANFINKLLMQKTFNK